MSNSSTTTMDRPVISNRELLLKTLPLPAAEVVDIGCGDGRLARMIAEHGRAKHVFGIECSLRQLEKAHEFPADERVSILEGIAQSLPFSAETIDIVIFFNSLHHIPEDAMDLALHEAARILRPDGLLYVCEPIAEGPFFTLCQPVDDETRVRAAAQDALGRVLRSPERSHLKLVKDLIYSNMVKLRSFDAFKERITSANPERDAIFEAKNQTLRAMFDDLAERDEDGAYLFEQPSYMILMQKVP